MIHHHTGRRRPLRRVVAAVGLGLRHPRRRPPGPVTRARSSLSRRSSCSECTIGAALPSKHPEARRLIGLCSAVGCRRCEPWVVVGSKLAGRKLAEQVERAGSWLAHGDDPVETLIAPIAEGPRQGRRAPGPGAAAAGLRPRRVAGALVDAARRAPGARGRRGRGGAGPEPGSLAALRGRARRARADRDGAPRSAALRGGLRRLGARLRSGRGERAGGHGACAAPRRRRCAWCCARRRGTSQPMSKRSSSACDAVRGRLLPAALVRGVTFEDVALLVEDRDEHRLALATARGLESIHGWLRPPGRGR